VRESPRARHLRVKYGLSEAQFNELADRYFGACWICRKIPKGTLQVDHDHKTGEIRGLLDWWCNKSIGYQWTAERLLSAADYMQGIVYGPPRYGGGAVHYTGYFVPKKKRKANKK
jgi:hypothetical protein